MAGCTGDAVAETTGLVVFEAESVDAAQRIMVSDPAVADGVMTANLYPYRVAVTGGAFSANESGRWTLKRSATPSASSTA